MAVAMDLCKDPVEAEALVFDTLGETVRNIKSLTHPKALFSWMCRILVSIHSRNTRRKSTEHIVYSDTLPEPPPDDEGVNRVIRAVDGKLLHEAIDRLPPKLKETVILRYFMDMPTLHVARFLMVPVGTVSSRLHMARTILGMRLGAKLKKSTVAVFAAALLLIGATAATVVELVSAADGGDEAAAETEISDGAETDAAAGASGMNGSAECGEMPLGPYVCRMSVFNHWSGERTYSYRVMVAQPVGSYDIYARVTAVTISVAGVDLVNHPDIRKLDGTPAIEFAYTKDDPDDLARFPVSRLMFKRQNGYIESTGNLEFNTGCYVGPNTKLELDFALTSIAAGEEGRCLMAIESPNDTGSSYATTLPEPA